MNQSQFVLFTLPRTGSTMMTTSLSSVEGVMCLPAIFSNFEWAKEVAPHFSDERWRDLESRLGDPERLIRELREALASDKQWFGLKHHVGETNVTRALLELPNTRSILLSRDNYLACYASNKIAVLQRFAEPGEKVGKCSFIGDEFKRYVMRRRRHYERFDNLVEATGASVFRIEYLEARTDRGFNSVADFLGLPKDRAFERLTTKRNSDNVLSRFSNPEAAARYVSAMGLQHWFEEGSAPER